MILRTKLAASGYRPIFVHRLAFLRSSRYLYSTTTTEQQQDVPQEGLLPERGAAKLNKRLIRVSGLDTAKFLNGLISNRIEDSGFGTYCGFLNSKGRVVSDSFIYPTNYSSLFESQPEEEELPSYLIECDPEVEPTLLKSLQMYKLRANVDIEAVDPNRLNVWHVWDETSVVDSIPLDIQNPDAVKPYCPELVGATDPRAPGFGLRLVLKAAEKPSSVLSHAFKDIPEVSASEYNVRRMLWGVPEGSKDLAIGSALPIESCMDYMNGIDFEKGCYVGQELTIRTHHIGTVRKRIVPVSLSLHEDEADVVRDLAYNPNDPICSAMDTSLLAGAAIKNSHGLLGDTSAVEAATMTPSPFGDVGIKAGKKRPAGTLVSAIGNVGLALIRLETFANAQGGFCIDTPQGPVYVQAYIPFWWPEQYEGDLQECPR